MFTVTTGTKIKFEYDLDTLFDNVSLDTLTHASKMVDAKGEDQVDNYGMVEEERSSFNQFISEGSIKVFQKLVKMTSGIADSFKINPTGTGAVKQKDTVLVTGHDGYGYITGTGGLVKQLIFTDSVKQKSTITITGDNGGASINGMALNTAILCNSITLSEAVVQYVASYASGWLTKGLVLTGFENTLIFESSVAGVPFTTPIITNQSGNLNGQTIINTQNFTGTIETTIQDFVDNYANDYYAVNIIISKLGEFIIFESVIAGLAFLSPVWGMPNGSIAITVSNTIANSTTTKTVSFEIKDKASYNANYLPIIDEEINLALMNFVMKEWFSKCNLGELAKYYNEKYNENIRMIIRNSISLRKPSLV